VFLLEEHYNEELSYRLSSSQLLAKPSAQDLLRVSSFEKKAAAILPAAFLLSICFSFQRSRRSAGLRPMELVARSADVPSRISARGRDQAKSDESFLVVFKIFIYAENNIFLARRKKSLGV
jgi:hypothetical protein